MSLVMEDELGIVYVVETAQQFWSELEDIINVKGVPTLQELDSTLKRWLSLCATYHEQYLQSPLQLEHACGLLLDSELFAFHSERMMDNLVETIQSNTDPHNQFMAYSVFLCYGTRRPDVYKSTKRWRPLVPLLMDHVLVDIDAEDETGLYGGHVEEGPVIEVKLRTLSVRLLYEMCRWQKLSQTDLRVFDDSFVDHLFDLVEQTRDAPDETFNHLVIKFIVSLNEQFMVASVSEGPSSSIQDSNNRVLRVLVRRLGTTKTFGENMIHMLNRAERSPDDLCMQLLVLKLIYLIFTTKGTSEYFYTNDLCVLVDVFLREVVDLDDDSESLRHTYLRVLHPLLTRTQLRDVPYKRPQIKYSLESLVRNEDIRDINATTRRLVERCLSGDWCVGLRKADVVSPPASDGGGISVSRSHLGVPTTAQHHQHHGGLKSSRSVENMRATERRGSEISIAGAKAPMAAQVRKGTADSLDTSTFARKNHYAASDTASEAAVARSTVRKDLRKDKDIRSVPSSPVLMEEFGGEGQFLRHKDSVRQRREPPAPPKRRKPPAIPVRTGPHGTTYTTIQSSSPSPLSNHF
ncbi:hypothetical protein CYLTODRAFT_377301 [Cylindrobasidium torrendii FP15055 ss-10]|uniref:SPIN90/Ldb17 leucine-rich domain-containing protein n=1 Tax=Cylindrobasidium torrendii FP15055 ss-10 TaxID=1314674 RepID=A0A0D7B8F7_9AGAR|nr:hypothetical protein CYLTODRAFT_377301 [Cylindrobasidium torrendii FP15055 ss-10]